MADGGEQQKASDLFIECLEAEGCEYIFGVPGEENLDFLDSLSRSEQDQAGPDPARAGRGLHGRDLRPPHRQDRRVPGDARPGRDQLRHRRRLCPARRHADADDHRAEADQEIEAGPLPDPRRGRDDGADHQVHPPARRDRQHPQPGARGLSPGRGGEARRGPSRAPRGHRRRAHHVAPDPALGRAAALGRAQGGAPGGRGDRGGQGAGAGDRRGRQPQDDRADAAPVRSRRPASRSSPPSWARA